MKALIAIALVLGLGAVYFLKLGPFGPPAHYKAYIDFAEARYQGMCPKLRELAIDQALEWVEDYCYKAEFTVFGVTKKMPSAANRANDMASSSASMRLIRHRERLLDQENSDGTVSMKIKETATRPKTNLSRGGSAEKVYLVTMIQSGGGWKVSSFVDQDDEEEEYEDD